MTSHSWDLEVSTVRIVYSKSVWSGMRPLVLSCCQCSVSVSLFSNEEHKADRHLARSAKQAFSSVPAFEVFSWCGSWWPTRCVLCLCVVQHFHAPLMTVEDGTLQLVFLCLLWSKTFLRVFVYCMFVGFMYFLQHTGYCCCCCLHSSSGVQMSSLHTIANNLVSTYSN